MAGEGTSSVALGVNTLMSILYGACLMLVMRLSLLKLVVFVFVWIMISGAIDGALGYEAIRCNDCNLETDANNESNFCERADNLQGD